MKNYFWEVKEEGVEGYPAFKNSKKPHTKWWSQPILNMSALQLNQNCTVLFSYFELILILYMNKATFRLVHIHLLQVSMAWDKEKKSTAPYYHRKKNFFVSELNRHPTSTKNINSFLTTVLLWCMVQLNQTRPLPKKNRAAVPLWYSLRKKTQLALDPPRKKNIFSFPTTVLIQYMGLEKNQYHWIINEKNIFLFLTTVLLQCTGLRNFLIHTRPHRKKTIVPSYGCFWGKNFHRFSTATEKELFVATVLLWCTRHKNYFRYYVNV